MENAHLNSTLLATNEELGIIELEDRSDVSADLWAVSIGNDCGNQCGNNCGMGRS